MTAPSQVQSFHQPRVTVPWEALAQQLADTAKLAADLDGKRKFYKILFLVMVVPAFIFAFIGFALLASSPAIGMAIIAVMVGTTVYSLIRWLGLSKASLTTREVVLANRALGMLSRDMAPGAVVAFNSDFRPHDHAEKLKRTGQIHQWKTKFYVDPWLRMSGKLLDGTAFRLSATTHCQARHRWAKSRSGKSKLKSKKKEATVLALRLKFKPKRYPNLAKISQANGAVQLPPGVTLRRVGTAADSASISVKFSQWDNHSAKAVVGKTSGPHAIAMMFLSLYQILNLSKAIEKSQVAGGGK